MLKLTILMVFALIVLIMDVVIFINPEGYRNFLRNHPHADHSGKWVNASDTKIRVTSAIITLFLLASIIVDFIILKIVGLL